MSLLPRVAVVVLVASSVAFAGCTSGPQLEVSDTEAQATAFGNVNVYAAVTNSGEERGSATLKAQVELDSGNTYTKTKQVTVGPRDSNTYTFKFDIPLTESLSTEQFTYEVWLE